MNIVTGYTGTPHVTSNAVQGFNQGIFGRSNYVLEVGHKFAANIVDANNISIMDGEGVIQGVHFRIDPGTTDNVTIDNGTQGYNRIDLIVARYSKEALTGVESVNLVVIKGTPTTQTANEPTINTGNILNGETPVDFPLYKVSLSGITPTLTKLFNDRIIYKSNIVTLTPTEYKTGEYKAESQFSVTLPPGTYAMIVYPNAVQSNITSVETYITINDIDYAYQHLSNSDITNSIDFITVSSNTNANVHIIAISTSNANIEFRAWIRACRL